MSSEGEVRGEQSGAKAVRKTQDFFQRNRFIPLPSIILSTMSSVCQSDSVGADRSIARPLHRVGTLSMDILAWVSGRYQG